MGHAALPIAGHILTEHTGRMMEVLEHHAELRHGQKLAKMLQEVIFKTNELTVRQIEAILELTHENNRQLEKTLEHYLAEERSFDEEFRRETSDLRRRLELKDQMKDIKDQINHITRTQEVLQQFSMTLIRACGQAGLTFAKDLSAPYSNPKIGDGR